MVRSISLLLSVLGLSLAASTVACSGADAKNDDLDTSKLAVQQQKDGKPTGNGQTCSWGSIGRVTPVAPKPHVGAVPPSGGSSGGCDSNGKCWSYDAEGEPTPIDPAPGSSGSSGWSSSSSSGGSTSSSGGSSGGCTTDEKGNTHCWSYPSEPQPQPPPAPIPSPMPAPVPETFELGDWFPALDGCNTCTCTGVGIMCTVQICAAPPPPPPPPPPGKGCEHDGQRFAAGDRVPVDTCNTCSCTPEGFITCTERACVDGTPPPPSEPPPQPLPAKK